MTSLFKATKATALLLTGAILSSLLLASCSTLSPEPSETETSAETVTETAAETLDPAYDFPFPDTTVLILNDTPDADADTLTTIPIRTAEELLKIGNDPAYPLDGDYTLVADLDLSHIENFPPIGSAFSECGIVSGRNVFSGTFDGRGHALVGLNISVSETAKVHVGLFGSVGSAKNSDPAVIKNLVLKDVSVTGPALGSATYATLIGQANGYVTLDNIALLSGKVEVDNESGDILGIGSLIGQCRTLDTTGCTNGGIHITNIYSNVTVIGDNNGRSNYTSGLIGRIRGSDLGTLSDIVQLGSVTHEGKKGNAISTGDAFVTNRKSVFYLVGVGTDEKSFGSSTGTITMTNGKINIESDLWHIEKGIPPLLNCAYESSVFSPLDFLTLSLGSSNTENAVIQSFSLSNAIAGIPVKWISDNEKVISVEDYQAIVKNPKTGSETVTLTAYTANAVKTFTLRVLSAATAEIVMDYPTKTLYAKNYPGDTPFTWTVEQLIDGALVESVIENEGKLPLNDTYLNCKISLTVAGFKTLVYYYSNIPTLVIQSAASYNGVSSNNYSRGTMTICTTEQYQKTEYSGDIEIKGRGNSTAKREKRPFRLKLSQKAELFGMEKSKHWVLLANHMDRSNLRNKLSYDLGMSLGLAGCESVFVNVIFNGEFKGLYQFVEPIRIEEGRVDIFNWEEKAEEVASHIAAKEGLSDSEREALAEGMTANLDWVTSGVYKEYTISDYYDTSTLNITGGYLIENDAYYDEQVKFTTASGMKLMIHAPESLSTNKDMLNYIRNYIQKMENSLYAPNRLSKEGLHYTEYMDIDSFTSFLLVNEVFKNVELFYKSCFMYKDVDGLLTFGPIWDMDWAAGNYVNLDRISKMVDNWRHGQSQDREYWLRALMNDPYFTVLLCEKWADIQDELDDMMKELDRVAAEITVEAAINHEYWKFLHKGSVWEVDTLRQWLIDRRAWLDEQMSDPQTLLDSFNYYIASPKFSISDVTRTEDAYVLTVSVEKTNKLITTCEVVLNGKAIMEVELTDGMKIRIDKSLLREAGKYNSIELLGKKADGSYSYVQFRDSDEGASQADSACVFIESK